MSSTSDIFSNSSAFDAYLAELTQRLQSEREGRAAFLVSAVSKLEPLLILAQSLQNEATIAEVSSHLSAARDELEALQSPSG